MKKPTILQGEIGTSDAEDLLKSRTISMDLLEVLLGERIEVGSARKVFRCRLNPDLVVKVETRSGSFQNVMEAQFWSDVADDPELSKWFAPVHLISSCGTVLLQSRAEPARRSEYPDKLPTCITDLKYSNFGMLDGKFVCFDYGIIIPSVSGKRMRKAKWWSED